MNEDVACVCVYTSFHIYILYVQRDTTQPLKTDAFKLWCWRMLLRVPWTAGRANQSILKEINPEYSLQGLMLNLKLQYFGHLMRTADSLEKTLMREKIETQGEAGSRG